MKAVIQRVQYCRLSIDGTIKSEIQKGLLVLLGISVNDSESDIPWMSGKITRLRVFSDTEGKMNLSLKDIDGEIMLVSQFTLLGDCRKGNRPSFIEAARPEQAIPIYEAFIKQLEVDLGKKIATGVFGADMQLDFQNDGPVTIIIESPQKI